MQWNASINLKYQIQVCDLVSKPEILFETLSLHERLGKPLDHEHQKQIQFIRCFFLIYRKHAQF